MALNWDELQKITEIVGRKTTRRYRDVQWQDVSQHLLEWTVIQQETVEVWLLEMNESDPKEGVRRLYKAYYRIANRYVRAERARMTGYRPQDEFFYSLPQLRALLVMYFAEQWDAAPISDLPDRDAKLDLDRAFGELDYTTRNLLRMAYHGDGVLEERYVTIGQAMSCTKEVAENRVRGAVAALQDVLGGPNPWIGRKAVSNAHAASITHGDYDE